MATRAIVLANGLVDDIPTLRRRIAGWGAALVIAADGGSRHAAALGLSIDIVVGDLDSMDKGLRRTLAAAGARFVTAPAHKDETDLELALLHAVAQGTDVIAVLGALGGRLDMTLANVLLLTHPGLAPARVEVWQGDQTAWLIRPPGEAIPGSPGDTLSLIPLGGAAEGITTTDLAYPLRNETLATGPARGVSNVIAGAAGARRAGIGAAAGSPYAGPRLTGRRKETRMLDKNRTVNVSVQVLPLVEDVYPVVDKAIAVIAASGVRYEVGPMETVMEGPLDRLLEVAKAAHLALPRSRGGQGGDLYQDRRQRQRHDHRREGRQVPGGAVSNVTARHAPGWLREALPPALLIAFVLGMWQITAMESGLSAFILPSPVRVAQAAWRTRALLGSAIGTTMLETAIGLVVALVFGVALAAAMDLSQFLRRALYPLLVASQTVQILAIAPLLIIWFGFGLLPKVIIVILVCFFPMAVNTADGLASTDPDLIALLRAMGATRGQVWRMARLPAALPSFFSGLRVAVTYSVVGATIGEWVGGSAGLGLYMLRSKNALATDQVFVAIVITSLLSIGLFVLVYLVERAALPWYYSTERAQQWEETGIY